MKNSVLLTLAVLLAMPLRAQLPSGNTSSAPTATPPAELAAPATTVRVEGLLLEKGTKKPLRDVNVFILPHKLKATTDAQGRFVFEQVPEGEFQFVVSSTGFVRLEQPDRQVPTEPSKDRRLYLEKVTYHGFETTILGRAQKRDDVTRTLKAEQFLTMPGSQGDPVKAVQNLPGVARAPGVSSQVIIQGAAPQDTVYHIDDHEVPQVFHVGGLTSVIMPEAVESVDYLSSGYGAEYGRAMGGIVGLRTRDPATDRRKGLVFVDLLKAGGLIEGPIDEKSSYLFSARYSYIGFVLKEALRGNDQLDLTVAPSFGDITGIYKRKLSENDDLRVVTLASRDELKFLFKEPVREDPSVRGNFRTETYFWRVIPQWTHRHDSDRTSRWSLGIGKDSLSFDIGDEFLRLRLLQATLRGEYETPLSKSWKAQFGLDNEFTRASVDLKVPIVYDAGDVNNPVSSAESRDLSITADFVQIAPYWRNVIHQEGSKWTYIPSLRADYFSLTDEIRPAPRLALRYDQDASLFYRAATGLYYQPPEAQETNETIGNPDLKAPHAWHYTAGFEKDLREGGTRGAVLSSGLFYRQFEQLVIPSSGFVNRGGVSVPERYNNDGSGKAYGAEFQVRLDYKPWTGWITYTYSRSTREEPGQGEHLFRYDQTHNINLQAAVELGGNWRFAGRARFTTGNPFTPIVGGYFDSDNDVFVPERGLFFSERLSPFFQLDLRIDKKWIYNETILWGYLDVQNVTNQANPEAVRYSYDYSQRREVTGLPILPTIGIRGDF